MSRQWTGDDHQPASRAAEPPHGSGIASAGRILAAEKARMVRSWQVPVPAHPVIRKPQFMLGGRLAVVREPSFMLAARWGQSRSVSAPDQNTTTPRSAPAGNRDGVSAFSPPPGKPAAPPRDKRNGT